MFQIWVILILCRGKFGKFIAKFTEFMDYLRVISKPMIRSDQLFLPCKP